MAEKKPKKKTNSDKNKPSFKTQSGHPLTPNEAKFIDEYIKTGNATQAVAEAGYKVKAKRQYGAKLLSKVYIAEEIKFRLEERRQASIADADEIMQYFTDVMRGEIKDQFGLEASLGERTKAAQELAKRKIDIPNRVAGKGQQAEVRITLDWGSDPEEESKEEE